MGRTPKSWISLYGNVAIQRAECPRCDRTALVLDGRLACCGATPANPKTIRRETCPENTRRHPPRQEAREQLERQGNRCFYCLNPLGAKVLYERREQRLRVEWDHFVPFAYEQNNAPSNFVASCHICNKIKHDAFFESAEDAIRYIAERRSSIEVLSMP